MVSWFTYTKKVGYMRMLPDGTPDFDLLRAKKLIVSYDKLLKEALKMGFCYNDDICTYLHNERAMWINKIEQDSDFELICKLWKNGSVHVYNREDYLRHTQGNKVADRWRWSQLTRKGEK